MSKSFNTITVESTIISLMNLITKQSHLNSNKNNSKIKNKAKLENQKINLKF